MHFISLGKLFQSIGAKCWKALFPFEVLMRDDELLILLRTSFAFVTADDLSLLITNIFVSSA